MKENTNKKKYIAGVYIGAIIGIIIALSYYLLRIQRMSSRWGAKLIKIISLDLYHTRTMQNLPGTDHLERLSSRLR